MNRLLSIGFIFCLSILCVSGVAGAKVALESYSNFPRTVVCNEFSIPNCTVYMKATGISPPTAEVVIKYYDATIPEPVEVQSEPGCAVKGEFLTEIKPSNFPTATHGCWTAKLYKGTNLLASDTFTVTGDAIPEFPVWWAGLLIAGMVLGIYWILRNRKQHGG